MNTSLKFRKDIEALRGFAVIAVLFYHFNLAIFNNIFIKEFNEIGMAYSILFSTFIGEIIIWIVFHKIVIKRSLFKSFEIIIFKPLFISLILYAFIDYVILQISNNLLGMMFSLIYPIAIVLLYHLFSIINVKNYIKKGPNLL